MARFKNVSGVPQQIFLPSTHLTNEGRFWDRDAPKKILVPDEILETSLERDVIYLRNLTQERTVRVASTWLHPAAEDKKQLPGVLIELV